MTSILDRKEEGRERFPRALRSALSPDPEFQTKTKAIFLAAFDAQHDTQAPEEPLKPNPARSAALLLNNPK
jgi:hypothetical protein